MNSEHSDRRWSDYLIPVICTFALIVAGLLFSELGLELTLTSIIYTGGITITAAVVSALVTKYLIKSQIDITLKRMHRAITSLAASRTVSDEFIAEREHEIKCKHIWIITPDLHKDVAVGDSSYTFRGIVSNNVTRRGINYTYIVHKATENTPKIDSLLRSYSEEDRKKIRIFQLSPDQWDRLPYTDGDFVIYNPTMEGEEPPESYYELPVKSRDQWIKADNEVVLSWIGRIQQIVPEILKEELK